MGILNVTPDSFSDGGSYALADEALRRGNQMVAEGADIIDIGGESSRPGGERIGAATEISRIVPIIEAIARQIETPISIDTSKSEVAQAAIDAGAEIINDISGLRWDERIAEVTARSNAGLVLMHSRGTFAEMHSQQPVKDIYSEVTNGLARSAAVAKRCGVTQEQIVLDAGIGFGKTPEQNLEIIRAHRRFVERFPEHAFLGGASRKSFIGKMLGDRPVGERLAGSVAAALTLVRNGASIVRVHDVRETADALCIATELGLFDQRVIQ